MATLKLKSFVRNADLPSLPLYPVGEVLKISEGLREITQTEAEFVRVVPTYSCEGCLFQPTKCSAYLQVRCTASERGTKRSVIFIPCNETGEPV
jgi:hypothetical protein